MTVVDIHVARTHFPRLVPLEPAPAPRRSGSVRDLGRVGDDFDPPMGKKFLAGFG